MIRTENFRGEKDGMTKKIITKQLWALAFESRGSFSIYPFWFTPLKEGAAPDIDEAMRLIGVLDNFDQDEESAWIDRIDIPRGEVDYPTYVAPSTER